MLVNAIRIVLLSVTVTAAVGCGNQAELTAPSREIDSQSNDEFELSYQLENGLLDAPIAADRYPKPTTGPFDWPGIPTADLQNSGEFDGTGAPLTGAALAAAANGFEPFSFVNYETPHVHPIDVTADDQRLLAVNTAANTLMVFDISAGEPVFQRSIPVGVDPVTVRARGNTEAWVVNHISDSISVVNVNTGAVTRTIATADEPADVVFAGTPARAFVSASQANQVNVFQLNNLDAAPIVVPIFGEDPRMLSVSPDGQSVYVGIFESGNATTVVAGGKRLGGKLKDAVVRQEGPYGGLGIPPNDGNSYSPPMNPTNPAPLPVSMIVRKDDQGRWMDDNNGDWTRMVSGDLSNLSDRVEGWDVPDRDVAIIDANDLSISYEQRLMNMVMALETNPATGELLVVGTDATNEIRWEPNLKGTFLRVNMALLTPGENSPVISDLNPHLNYLTRNLPESERSKSIGDPRGIAWTPDGTTAYITGMGSNSIVVIDSSGNRQDLISVGEGPTGIVIRDARAYVLNRFDGSISVLNILTNDEESRVSFFDPTPASIKDGRPILYNTVETSGLGQASCASCHVDARTDRLVWDLSDPTQGMLRKNNATFHPLKGPLKTQSFQDIIGVPAMHHSGDKDNIFEFADSFVALQGDDAPMDNDGMQKLEDMLDSIHYPPNPFRNIDNSLSTSVDIPGPNGTVYATADAELGRQQYLTGNGTSSHCAACHGHIRTRAGIVKGPNNGFVQNVPLIAENLRGFYDRVGMWRTSADGSTSGFGFLPDGSQGGELINTDRNFPMQSQSGLHVHAFMLSLEGPVSGMEGLARDSHAGVGQQVTLSNTTNTTQMSRFNNLIQIANSGNVGLVAHGFYGDRQRGMYYNGDGIFQSDRLIESVSVASLVDAVERGGTITLTVVPLGSQYRLGADADTDGVLDQDERSANTNPLAITGNEWRDCASEGGTCSFDGTAPVRFGADGTYLYGVFNGSVMCTTSVFGNDKEEATKSCQVATAIATPPPTEDCRAINFALSNVSSYSASQDGGSYSVQNGGSTLRVTDNGWKAVAYPMQVSASTIMEFDFSSSRQGEEHSIGIDQDLRLTNGQRFKVFGSQNTTGVSLQDFNDYPGDGSTKRYRIPLGDYLSGSFGYIIFTADHDSAPANGDSVFSNVNIYDDPEGDGCNVRSVDPIIDEDTVTNVLPPVDPTTPTPTPTPTPNQQAAITVDGNLSEWGGVTPFAADPSDTSGGADNPIDWSLSWISHDNANVYLAYTTHNPVSLSWGHGVYLDTDQNRNTGFKGFGNEFAMGVDYIIEGADLLRYTGTGNDWSWQGAGTVTAAVNDDTVEIALGRDLIGNTSAFDVFFFGKNQSFSGTELDFYPDGVENSFANSETRRFRYAMVATPAPDPTPVSANLLINGDFEQNKNNWIDCALESLTSISTDANSGVGALQVNALGCIYQEFPVVPGKEYSLSCKGKSAGSEYSSISIQMTDQNYVELASSEVPVTGNVYNDYQTTLIAADSAAQSAVTLYSEYLSLFDDCIVTEQ